MYNHRICYVIRFCRPRPYKLSEQCSKKGGNDINPRVESKGLYEVKLELLQNPILIMIGFGTHWDNDIFELKIR